MRLICSDHPSTFLKMHFLDAPTMPPPSLSLSWLNNLDGLSAGDLEILRAHFRYATFAVEADLQSKREEPRSPSHSELSKSLDCLRKHGLRSEHKRFLNEAIRWFTHGRDWNSYKYSDRVGREFIQMVSRVYDWPFALSVLVSMRLGKLNELSEPRRISLFRFFDEWRTNRHFLANVKPACIPILSCCILLAQCD